MRVASAAAALLLSAATASAQPAAPGPTLSQVRQRGTLACGIPPGVPGFGAQAADGTWQGLEVDICRAIAAAVLGDAQRARFTPLSSQARFPALQQGQVDVLTRAVTWTQSRDTQLGFNFGPVTFYDGQGFLTRRANISRAQDLQGSAICTFSGSTSEANLADWARANRVTYTAVLVSEPAAMRTAYEEGRCAAMSTDASQLVGILTTLRNPAEHQVLPDRISKEPLAPVVRHGDEQWTEVVRWTVFALIEAEELGVTSGNAEAMLASDNPAIRRLLGANGDHGPMMGLDARWAFNAIRQVGNYGEIFERNLGAGSPIGLARGVNDQWTRGGLMYAPPIR
ncbi:amino acid ABC transporter substrate-binding protein [Roseomonas sp. PWR1]|uniref:Amino acid ABC transporter substrate-binding protein n=2 Tax=Roseomonas nitratireducens TaxID=2820810 RepID=A0ABS4ARE8_9PROT|nr:amino acid ABC transporter substrate-binding protein [Neoroseomonas nitratireducens]